MTIELRTITADETLAIRHKVLWPDKPLSYIRLDDDDAAWHIGAFENETLVCVATVFVNGDTARLRKFATLPEHQSMGIGSAVVSHILAALKKRNVKTFWCDARLSATGFYRKFGMNPEGPLRYKGDTPYTRMVVSLDP